MDVLPDIDLKAPLFGHLDRADTSCQTQGCGPTAAVNSFVYLQSRYPKRFPGRPLVPRIPPGGAGGAPPTANDAPPTTVEMVAVAETLIRLMGTNETDGTFIEDFIWGKYSYLESVAKGKVRYGARIERRWESPTRGTQTVVEKPAWVRDEVTPKFEYLYSELKRGEDVEILVDRGRGIGHYFTVTGVFPTSATSGRFGLIDPSGGTDLSDAESRYEIGDDQYMYLTDFADARWRVVAVVTESPVPAPGSLALLASLLVPLFAMRVVRAQRSRSATAA